MKGSVESVMLPPCEVPKRKIEESKVSGNHRENMAVTERGNTFILQQQVNVPRMRSILDIERSETFYRALMKKEATLRS